MGALKDAVDLLVELQKRVTDRKILDALFPIKQKILEAKEENIELQGLNFKLTAEFSKKEAALKEKNRILDGQIRELNFSHAEEMSRVKAEHAKEILSLESKISEISVKKGMQVMKIER